MSAQHTPGPWSLCQHLRSIERDRACSCGYRGVVFGPDATPFAICQPGHDPAPGGQEGTEPARYPREVEIANARLIAAAPELLDALEALARHDFDDRDDPVIYNEVCRRARAAIAKARGQA